MQVVCRVISLNKSQRGIMFNTEKDFTFEDLILWVYRNCPGDRVISIENNEVYAKYEDRIEVYSFEENIKTV